MDSDELFQVQTPPNHSLPTNSIVSELINKESGEWNEQLIDEIFWPHEAASIKSIPLGSAQNSDKLIWHHTRNGLFTIRSAYDLILTRNLSICGNNNTRG